jgi:hypothetical protein
MTESMVWGAVKAGIDRRMTYEGLESTGRGAMEDLDSPRR